MISRLRTMVADHVWSQVHDEGVQILGESFQRPRPDDRRDRKARLRAVRVVLRRESQRPPFVWNSTTRTPCVSRVNFKLAVRCKISRLFRLHGNPPDYKNVPRGYLREVIRSVVKGAVPKLRLNRWHQTKRHGTWIS